MNDNSCWSRSPAARATPAGDTTADNNCVDVGVDDDGDEGEDEDGDDCVNNDDAGVDVAVAVAPVEDPAATANNKVGDEDVNVVDDDDAVKGCFLTVLAAFFATMYCCTKYSLGYNA
jgi:hypothetical protein